MITDVVWVSWEGATVAHAAAAGERAGDVRNGSFPLRCGRWAPDGWDREVFVRESGPRCRRCEEKVL